MNTVLKYLLFVALFFSGCSAVVVDKPVSQGATIIPSSPGPTYVWVGDSWAWDNQTRVYVLREGYWVQPKRRSAVWVEGHWKKTRGGWKYVRGHWRR